MLCGATPFSASSSFFRVTRSVNQLTENGPEQDKVTGDTPFLKFNENEAILRVEANTTIETILFLFFQMLSAIMGYKILPL